MFDKFLKRRQKKQPDKKHLSAVLDEHLSILTKSTKIKNSVFVMSLVIGLLFMFYRFALMEQDQYVRKEPHIAVVDFKGAVSADNEQGSGFAVASAIKQAFDNPNSRAVVIRANSGGGSPVQAEMINQQLVRLKNKRSSNNAGDVSTSKNDTNKPIIVIVEDTCASACYMAAVAADRIIAHPSSLVGSIGVRIDSWQVSDALETLGVERLTLTSGENKALLDPFVAITDEMKDKVKFELITPLYQLFVDTVKDARGSKLDTQHPDIFSGMIFHGNKALELGLIDKVDTYPMALDDLYAETGVQRVVFYNEKKFSLTSLIQSSFDKSVKALLTEHITIR